VRVEPLDDLLEEQELGDRVRNCDKWNR
jgi:hypothetical protein